MIKIIESIKKIHLNRIIIIHMMKIINNNKAKYNKNKNKNKVIIQGIHIHLKIKI
jgi:hypothetical protein